MVFVIVLVQIKNLHKPRHYIAAQLYALGKECLYLRYRRLFIVASSRYSHRAMLLSLRIA